MEKSMTRVNQLIDVNLLRDIPLAPAESEQMQLPHVLTEQASSFSIVMNLLGMKQEDVVVQLDGPKKEITVIARKERWNVKRGFFWVFGVPASAVISAAKATFKGGVLEISIPKRRLCAVA